MRKTVLLGLLVSAFVFAEDHRVGLSNEETTGRLTVSGKASPTRYGLRFECSPDEINAIEVKMRAYFEGLNFPLDQIRIEKAIDGSAIQFGLKTEDSDTSTIDLVERPALKIPATESITVRLQGTHANIEAPSRNEIIAGLMQHGRLMEFSGKKCDAQKVIDHVLARQRVALWARSPRNWGFATGDGTRNNLKEMWDEGWVAKMGIRSTDAVADAFIGNTGQYSIACNRECRLIMAQGVLDFAESVKKDKVFTDNLELIADRQPMYKMRPEDDEIKVIKEGKLLDRALFVPANNWIPGDWGWIKNVDEKSSDVSGYEGSNTVYTGGNHFANLGSGGKGPSFEDKVRGVYQWRDYAIQKPWTPELFKEMSKDPRDGGLLLDFRDFPKPF